MFLHSPFASASRRHVFLRRLALVLTLLCLSVLSRAAFATTYYVSPSGSDSHSGTQAAPFLTIQHGINTAVNGDIVTVEDGTYTGPGNVDLDLRDKNITVMSVNGAGATIINCGGYYSTDGSGNHCGFNIYSFSGGTTTVIRGLTIKNGYKGGPKGGSGGGIVVEDTTAIIQNCILTYNTADNGGGGIAYGNSNSDPYNSTITLTDCIISNNTSRYGSGGIAIQSYKNSSVGSSTITLTNCVISGNAGGSSSYGGGLSSNNIRSTTVLTNCTFSNNTASIGSGIYTDTVDGGMIILSNDIFFGDPATYTGEIANADGTDSNAVATYCDIQGGYAGTGNINTDPLFVSAANGDFHLRPGSPCLGKGTPNAAPTMTIDGMTRPIPPSIGAYEAGAVPASLAHILWNYTDHTASFWTLDANGSYTHHEFGPYPGWTAKAIADGPDGHVRVLWANSGAISLWNLDNIAGTYTHVEYGPFDGWTAQALAVGPDNAMHLLWTHAPDGQASVWTIDSSGSISHAEYGAFGGWTAKSLTVGPDGNVHLLWTHAPDGQASLWTIDVSGNIAHAEYGAFDGWTAVTTSEGPDNTLRLLWNHSADNQVSLWQITSGGATSHTEYGPFGGWASSGLSVGSDDQTRILWNHASDGQMSLWSVDAVGNMTHGEYGPFGGWTAASVGAP